MQRIEGSILKKIQKIELDTLIEFDRVCKENKLNYSLSGGTLLGAIRHGGFIPWDDDIDVVMPRKDFEEFERIANQTLSDKFFYQCHASEKNYFRLYGKIRVNGTVFRELAQVSCDIHHGVYIDIFPIDSIPKNSFLRAIQFYRYKFYDSILSSKIVNNPNRSPIKKFLAKMIKFLFFPMKAEFLYKKLYKISTKYKSGKELPTRVFSGAYSKKEVFRYGLYTEFVEATFCGRPFKILKDYDLLLKKIYGNYLELPPEEKRLSHHDVVELKIEE